MANKVGESLMKVRSEVRVKENQGILALFALLICHWPCSPFSETFDSTSKFTRATSCTNSAGKRVRYLRRYGPGRSSISVINIFYVVMAAQSLSNHYYQHCLIGLKKEAGDGDTSLPLLGEAGWHDIWSLRSFSQEYFAISRLFF